MGSSLGLGWDHDTGNQAWWISRLLSPVTTALGSNYLLMLSIEEVMGVSNSSIDEPSSHLSELGTPGKKLKHANEDGGIARKC